VVKISAIGNYIHYSKTGYDLYGNNGWNNKINSTNRYAVFREYKNNFAKKIKNKKSPMTKEERIELRNSIYELTKAGDEYQKGNTSGNAELDKLFTYIQDAVNQKIINSGTTTDINYNTGVITLNGIQSYLSTQKLNLKKGLSENAKFHYLKTVNNKIKELNNAVELLSKELEPGNIKRQECEAQIKQINEKWEEIKKYARESRSGKNIVLDKQYFSSIYSTINQNLNSNLSLNTSLFDDLAKLETELKVTGYENVAAGLWMEMVTAFAMAKADIEASENADEIINNIVTSIIGTTGKEKLSLKTENFSGLANWAKDGNWSLEGDEMKLYSYASDTQGKIDVSLEYQDKNIGVSVKNAKLDNPKFNETHIVSGTNLAFLIQDEDHDFVNHYLNTIAKHGKTRHDTVNIILMPTNMRKQASLAIGMVILYKALSGDTFQRNKADIMVIKNKGKSGKESIMVLDIPYIVQQAENKIDEAVAITFNGKDYRDYILENAYEESYQKRITKIITDIRRTKVNAALRNDFTKALT
jgi:hypothetical protein